MKLIQLSLVAAMPLVRIVDSGARPSAARRSRTATSACSTSNAVSKDKAKAEAEKSVKTGGGQLKHVYSTVLRGFSTNMSAAGIENARNNNPNIAYCEQDQVVTTGQVRAKAPPGRRRQRPAGAGNPVGHHARRRRRRGHLRHGMGDRLGHRPHPPRPQRRHRAQPQLPRRQHHAGRPERSRHPRRRARSPRATTPSA